MENLNIAIVADDKEYGRALGLAIINVCRSLVINVFNKEEFTTVQENYSLPDGNGRVFDGFDMILWEGELTRDRGSLPIIRLVEKPSMTCAIAEEGRFCIYKYSPAQHMISELFRIYTEITGRKPVSMSRPGVHVHSFASWAGGTGCTSIAMGVAQELTRFHGKKVLYISLEELESIGHFIKVYPGTRTMSYYLYNLFKDRQTRGVVVREETGTFKPFMESFVIKDDFGVEAFRPTKGRNPLVALDSDEICVFIESVMNSGRYDEILIDTGAGLSPAAITCLEMAEKICLVGVPTENLHRETHFVQYLMCVGGEDMARKMIKVINKKSNVPRFEFLDGDDPEKESIVEASMAIMEGTINSIEDGVTKILLEGGFGQSISTLTDLLLEPLK